MGRFVVIATLVIALLLGAVASLVDADVELRFYALVFVVGIAAIAVGILLTALFAWILLRLLSWLGQALIGDRFELFMGWNLLRSHRVRGSFGTFLRNQIHAALTVNRRRRVVALGLGLALIGGGIWVGLAPAPHNALVEAVAPLFALLTRIALLAVGGLLVLYGGPALIGRKDTRPPERVVVALTKLNVQPFVAIIGVSMGVWSLILVLSGMHGFAADLQSKILRTNAHVVVEPEDASGMLGDGLALADTIGALPAVAESHVMAYGEVMMSSSTNIAVNVVVKGMTAEALASSHQLEDTVEPGDVRYLSRPELLLSDRFRYPIVPLDELGVPQDPEGHAGDPAKDGDDEAKDGDDEAKDGDDTAREDDGDDGKAPPPAPTLKRPPARVYPGVILGAELARSLNLGVGAEVQIISPDGDVGPTGLRPKLKSFRVAGIFTTGMYEYDQKLAYMALDDAQRFFNLGADTNRMEVRLADGIDADEALADVKAVLAREAPELTAMGWKERNKNLFSALQLERIAMFIILGLTMLVAALAIVSSLVMIIVQKARDIAVLKALGASNRGIVRTFLVIGGFIGVLATFTGVLMGVGMVVGLQTFGLPMPQAYYIPTLPMELDPVEVAIVGLSAIAVCMLATVYPSWAASRLDPVEGLRHG